MFDVYVIYTVFKLLQSYRSSINALLTIWMVVIGFGVSLTHAHTTNSPRHVHGCGWNLRLFSIASTTGSSGVNDAHRHLILLGVELPNESTPDSDFTGASITDSALGNSCDTPLQIDFAVFALHASTPSYCYVVVTNCLIKTAPPRLDPSVTLSAFARHALTGVLRS